MKEENEIEDVGWLVSSLKDARLTESEHSCERRLTELGTPDIAFCEPETHANVK